MALVGLRDEFRVASRHYPELRAKVRSDTLAITFTGWLAFKSDLDQVLERDLCRSELVSFPLVLVVLLLVFATIVASTLPVGVGGLAVACGVAAVLALSHVTNMAQYAVNVVTLIGLGVAIDYSFFIVSRYREELAGGASVPEALGRTIATAGRTVIFSALAVGIGLGGLLFYPRSYLETMGLAGAIVVLLAALFALTFLPALLAILGRNVDAARLPIPRAWRMPGLWRWVATWVMCHPVLVAQDDGGTANGGIDTSSPQAFTITVGHLSGPPIAESRDEYIPATGEPAAVKLVASDPNGATLTYTILSQPSLGGNRSGGGCRFGIQHELQT